MNSKEVRTNYVCETNYVNGDINLRDKESRKLVGVIKFADMPYDWKDEVKITQP